MKRSMEDISSVTLEDPLLLRYIQEAKSISLNNVGQLCLEATPSWDPRVIDKVSGEKMSHCCIPTIIANFGAEHAFPQQAYDTVIMMNVIEHALDARKILDFVSLDKTRCRFRCLPSTEVEADADLAEWQELPNVIEDPRRTVYSIAKKPRLELVAEHEKCHVVDYLPSKKIFRAA